MEIYDKGRGRQSLFSTGWRKNKRSRRESGPYLFSIPLSIGPTTDLPFIALSLSPTSRINQGCPLFISLFSAVEFGFSLSKAIWYGALFEGFLPLSLSGQACVEL